MCQLTSLSHSFYLFTLSILSLSLSQAHTQHLPYLLHSCTQNIVAFVVGHLDRAQEFHVISVYPFTALHCGREREKNINYGCYSTFKGAMCRNSSAISWFLMTKTIYNVENNCTINNCHGPHKDLSSPVFVYCSLVTATT